MNQGDDKATLQNKDDFYVDVFRPEDAEGIVMLFRSVYGESYPIRLFYDPLSIITANTEGCYYSIVARLTTGKVIGVLHLYLSSLCKSLYEWGVGLVLKEYRNYGVLNQLADFLHCNFVPRNPNVEEIFGESVCNHTHIQKVSILLGYVETAIEVALMPSAAYSKEHSAPGRVATIISFRCCKPKPHRIYLPATYERELREIYRDLNDARELVRSDRELPRGKSTHAEMTIFDYAQVARIAVYEAGEDFRVRIAELEREAQVHKAVVVQVGVNLTEPWVGDAINALRDQGYFFSGALPRWFDSDGFLMQKLQCPPDFDDIVLHTDRAKWLLMIIRQDWERTVA
ncbi:MAG: hypothetical protein WCJ37_14700 [Syntrophus sp. (in: bacteria)]